MGNPWPPDPANPDGEPQPGIPGEPTPTGPYPPKRRDRSASG